MCTKKLAKESGIGPKTFGKYMILSQNVGKVLHFFEKHSKNIAFCKENIRRVSSSEPNHSRNTKVPDKTFEKSYICQQNILEISILRPKYSILAQYLRNTFEKFRICPRKKRKVSVSDQNHSRNIKFLQNKIEKYFYFVSKHSKSIEIRSKTFEKYHRSIEILSKIFEKYLLSAQNI